MSVTRAHYVFRIASETPAYTADDMSGAGAAAMGGRWNEPGVPAVYCSESRALSFLEVLAHLLPSLTAGTKPPGNRCLIEVKIPIGVWRRRVWASKLPGFPASWSVRPAGKGSIAFGTAWAKAATGAILVVPSVVVQQESNFIINPAHPDARAITASNTGPWPFDPRLLPWPQRRTTPAST